MKNLIILFNVCFLLADAQQKALVTSIVDADTYDLFYKGKNHRVRLAHIDAPELKQNYGQTAAEQVKHLLYYRSVLFDSTGKDLYGRLVGNLLLNGKRVDSLLVRKGLAWYNSNYGRDPTLGDCMRLAIAKRRGLWQCGVENVCPPWLFRSFMYQNFLRYCKSCSEIIQPTFKN
jgi:micrococcal nuclease